MNKKEAKQYTLKYLTDVFVSNGFVEKKKGSSDIEFTRKTSTGEDGMYLHFNEVIKAIGGSVKLNPPIPFLSSTYKLSLM